MRPPLTPLCAIALLAASADATQLVKNINEQARDSSPSGFVSIGTRVYFAATDPLVGREYFWIDENGGPPQLLADVAPGASSSNPSDLIQLDNGLLLFVAESPTTGREVWVSDGTPMGTHVLVDLTGPGGMTGAHSLVSHQGSGYFMARAGTEVPMRLWRTDGTTAGTVQIEDLGPAGILAHAKQLMVSNGERLFFLASSAFWTGSFVTTWGLYTTDGTPGGATLVATAQGNTNLAPTELTVVGSGVVWEAPALGKGHEFWFSDGTPAGTGMLDLLPGSGSSNPSEFTAVGSLVYFAANSALGSRQVFVTDGTAAGTYKVTSFGHSGWPTGLAAVGNQVAFARNDGIHGPELWVADATVGSETLYADLMPGPWGSEPSDMIPFQGGILCVATDPQFGRELYFSDGTPAGTYRVKDIQPGPKSSAPHGLTPLGSKVVFSADSPDLGVELWITDGSSLGTTVLADLAPLPFDQSSNPRVFASLGDRIVFSADDGLYGPELWVSDGTDAGTMRLTTFPEDFAGTPLGVPRIKVFDGRAYFMFNDGVHGSELWVTDGTTSGTHLFMDVVPGPSGGNPYPLIEWKGELYFAAGGGYLSFTRLYATDGTPEGTRLVSSFAPYSPKFDATVPIVHKDHLYLAVHLQYSGTRLFRSDGTAAGTSIVASILPGESVGFYPLKGGSLGDFVYFVARTSPGFMGIWRTDGTPGGATLFADLGAPSNSTPEDFQRVGERLVFSATTSGERQYYSTDGDTLVQLSFPPLTLDAGSKLHFNGTKLVGVLRGPGDSYELWATDGTPGGSGVIRQILPAGASPMTVRAWRVSSGPKLLFAAGDATVASAIFVTDGTAAGTGSPFPLNHGPGSSSTDELVRMGDHLYFNAVDTVFGMELYRFPWAVVDDWLAEPFGAGCVGSSGAIPTLKIEGSARPGGTLIVGIEQAAPLAPVFHFSSAGYGLTDLGGCSMYLSAPSYLVGGATDGFGQTSLVLPIPNQPSLVGKGLWMQSLVLDAGAGLFGGASLTPALEIRFGG